MPLWSREPPRAGHPWTRRLAPGGPNLSESEAAAIAAKVGAPRNLNGGVSLDLRRVRAMRNAGFTVDQVAAYFGVGRTTVYRRLRGGT